MIKVLIVGNGAREHALAYKLSHSHRVNELYAIPGNPGIAYLAKTYPIDCANVEGIVKFAQKHQISLVIVGPSIPLTLGLTDALNQAGIACFGPNKESAQFEASKAFAKSFLQKHHIPSTSYQYFTDAATAITALDYLPDAPMVIKHDDIGQGVGRFVAKDKLEAHLIINKIFNHPSGALIQKGIVIEEFLDNEELSIVAFVDGKQIHPMLPVQDYKCVHHEGIGRRIQTSGLGTFAPAELYTSSLEETIKTQILAPLATALSREGLNYCGFLHLRLILSHTGPKVSELLVTLGDPEAEVLLPLLRSDLYEIIMACLDGDLARYPIVWRPDYAVCLIMASGGYPKKFEINLPITDYCIDQASEEPKSWVYHACTKLNHRGKLVTAGGKVVAVTAIGKTLRDAQQCAYKRVHQISFKNCYFRPNMSNKEEAQLVY